MEEVGVLGHHAHGGGQRLQGGVTDVEPVDADRPGGHVVEPGKELADGGLAGSGRADQGHHLPRCHGEGHIVEDLGRHGGVEDGHRLEGGEGHLFGGGVPEVDVVVLDGGRALRHRTGDGGVDDHRLEVEDLEHPVKGDQGGHHVDLHVRQGRQRRVEPRQVRGQGHHGPDGQGPVDGLDPAPAVDDGGGQRRVRLRATMKKRAYMAWVTPMSRKRPARRSKVPSSSDGRPNSLTSRAPDTRNRIHLARSRPLRQIDRVPLQGLLLAQGGGGDGLAALTRRRSPSYLRAIAGLQGLLGRARHDLGEAIGQSLDLDLFRLLGNCGQGVTKRGRLQHTHQQMSGADLTGAEHQRAVDPAPLHRVADVRGEVGNRSGAPGQAVERRGHVAREMGRIDLKFAHDLVQVGVGQLQNLIEPVHQLDVGVAT